MLMQPCKKQYLFLVMIIF